VRVQSRDKGDRQKHLLLWTSAAHGPAQALSPAARQPARAGRGADARMTPSEEYSLAEVWERHGRRREALALVQASSTGRRSRRRPAGKRAWRRHALTHRQGRGARRRAPGTAMAERKSDPEVWPTSCSAEPPPRTRAAKDSARRPKVIDAGDARARRLSFCAGSYISEKRTTRAPIALMEAWARQEKQRTRSRQRPGNARRPGRLYRIKGSSRRARDLFRDEPRVSRGAPDPGGPCRESFPWSRAAGRKWGTNPLMR